MSHLDFFTVACRFLNDIVKGKNKTFWVQYVFPEMRKKPSRLLKRMIFNLHLDTLIFVVYFPFLPFKLEILSSCALWPLKIVPLYVLLLFWALASPSSPGLTGSWVGKRFFQDPFHRKRTLCRWMWLFLVVTFIFPNASEALWVASVFLLVGDFMRLHKHLSSKGLLSMSCMLGSGIEVR